MTIAIDLKTGAVVGQVLDPLTDAMPSTWALCILTATGVRTARRCDVRVETV